MNDELFYDHPEPPASPSQTPVTPQTPAQSHPQQAAPAPRADKPAPKSPYREPSGNARPLPAEEQQEIVQLLESIGGPTAGRVKLSLRRHEKGHGWRSLPPLEIEPWQFTDGGFDLEETVGQQYGDGKFAWILRYRGRFLRRGDLNVVGYGDVELEELETPESPAPVDLSDVVSRLKAEILGELKPLMQNRETDSTRMMHETMLRLIESKLSREPAPAPKPQGTDPIVASLITAMSAQTTSFMQLMAQQNGGGKSDTGSVLREAMGMVKDLLETTRSMVPPVQQANPVYEYEPEDELPEEPPATSPAAPQPSPAGSLWSEFGGMFEGTAKRILGTVLSTSEDKVTSKIAGTPTVGNPADVASASPQPPAAPPAAPAASAVFGEIIDAVDQCVSRKLPAERLATGLMENLPRPMIENLATVSPPVIAEMVKQMGQPEAAARFQRPDYVAFLSEVISLLRQKIGLPPVTQSAMPSGSQPPGQPGTPPVAQS